MMAKEMFGSGEMAGNVPKGTGGLVPDFLCHLQQRMGIDELTAAETLQLWMSTYEPGPSALARVGVNTDG